MKNICIALFVILLL